MSKSWLRSDLELGEELKFFDNELFVSEGNKALERLVGVYYIGETNSGIIVDCVFKPSFGRTAGDSHYRKFIMWASIFTGHVKVFKTDGSMVRAKAKKSTVL